MDEKALIKYEIQKDNISLSDSGFIRKHHGRSLCIFYISNDSIVFIDGELSGVPQYDFLIYAQYNNIKYAYFPKTDTFKELSQNEKQSIQTNLVEWLALEHIRHDIKVGF